MKLTIPKLLIVFSFALLVIGAMSCNTEKRATRHLYKSVRIDEKPARDYCAKVYNPIVITKDSFIYKQGAVIYKKGEPVYVQVDCDSVVKSFQNGNSSNATKVRIPCPPCDSLRVDTNYISSRNTEVNNAEIDRLTGNLSECDKDKAALEQALKMWKIIALGAIVLIALWVVLKTFRK